MFPSDVSMTARVRPSSSDVSERNGSGTGAGLSRMVTLVMTMRSAGTVASAGMLEIFCTTLIPSATRAKTVYWPSSAA